MPGPEPSPPLGSAPAPSRIRRIGGLLPTWMRARPAWCCAAVSFGLGVALTGTGTTFASFTDYDVVHGSVQAASWPSTLKIPDACGPVADYHGGVLVGTPGDDVLRGGNHGQVILGLGGNDVLIGGNAKDCLVGGEGDDDLDGGNGKDILDGGPGEDRCAGGHAPSILIDCESAPSARSASLSEPEPDASTATVPAGEPALPAPPTGPASDGAQQPGAGSGASPPAPETAGPAATDADTDAGAGSDPGSPTGEAP